MAGNDASPRMLTSYRSHLSEPVTITDVVLKRAVNVKRTIQMITNVTLEFKMHYEKTKDACVSKVQREIYRTLRKETLLWYQKKILLSKRSCTCAGVARHTLLELLPTFSIRSKIQEVV